MSESFEQQRLEKINRKRAEQLYQCPKAFYELLSFMDSELKKYFKGFSLFGLCQGSSHKLRFNDPNFEKAFQSLSLIQKLQLYEESVQYGIMAFGNDKRTKQQLDQLIDEQVKKILPKEYKQFDLNLHEGFRSNNQIKVKLEKFKLSAKNHFTINLQNYIIRKSKKKSPSYILQVINKTTPERIRFSFANSAEEKENLPLIEKLSELAFDSTINGMIIPEFSTKNSPLKWTGTGQSIGRLADPSSQKQLSDAQSPKKMQKIIDSKSVLQYSHQLSNKLIEQNRKPSPRGNAEIIQQLLSKHNLAEQEDLQEESPTYDKNGKIPQSENIYHKVLQTQNDVKQKYSPSVMRRQFPSPVRKLVSSEVSEVKIPTTDKKPIIKHKNVFELMLPEFNLRQFQPSINTKCFKQIYMATTNGKNNFTIYQHKEKPERFKVNLIIENKPIDEIYCILINQELLKKWNQCVDESQIKITLTAENCLICYQKHTRYNSWFKDRDFLFMRHAFTYKNCKYIADRSIEHNSFIPFQSIQRGYIRHYVTRLRELKDKRVQIIVDMSIDHGGYLGVEKKKQLNLNFLKEYEKLQNFINKNKTKPDIRTCYCDLNWNIDWIDELNDASIPKSLSLREEQFMEGSEIKEYEFNVHNVDLEEEDYFSVKDDMQTPNGLQQSIKDFKFETTVGFEQKQGFFKRNKLQLPPPQQQQQQIQQQQLEIQVKQVEEKNKSRVEQVSTYVDQSIVLDEEGYCILPQKYFKRRHPVAPKMNYTEERPKIHENVLLKNDFVEDKEFGIKLIDKEKIDAQNNVLKFVLKTMRKNVLSGKSILSISLPVEIFRADSNTQRLCQSMTLGPYFLQKAAKSNDPLQRMKYSICFALSNSIIYFYIDKPFNPILGETYQGMIDGCPIYAEQTSHHPPISSLYFVGRGYKVYGSLQAKVYLHLNSGDGVNAGFYTIEFDDGMKVRFQTPPGEVSGFTIGDRRYRIKDKLYAYDPKNRFFTALYFQDPQASFFSKSKWTYPDQMQGSILKVSQSFIRKFQSSQQKLIPNKKQIQDTLSKIEGRWIYHLKFDGKIYYDIAKDTPYQLRNYQYTLNSDARYREDLIYRMQNDLAKSQIYKEYLENKQRKDRKLREQYSGKAH